MRSRRFRPERLGSRLKTEFLDDYELSGEDFARLIRLPLDRVQNVLAGREAIDGDLALRLERLFGGSAYAWLSWENSYQLGNARERIGAELDAIVPLDPDTRVSAREDEPLEPEMIEEIRRRLDDVRDPRRWVIVSRILGADPPLHEESVSRMFYNVESNCYCMSLDSATAFKDRRVAEAVAETLGDRKSVIEVTMQDLEKPKHDSEVDRELRQRFFRAAGQGMSAWDVSTYLRDSRDMAIYLEVASEDGDGHLIAAAVEDVLKAMAAQTTVEYLRERGKLGDRMTYEGVLNEVRPVELVPIRPVSELRGSMPGLDTQVLRDEDDRP